MSQLQQVIDNLNTGERFAVSIIDNTTTKVIMCNVLASTIVSEYQNAESFFNQLHENGYTDISVQLKTKNGSTFKKHGLQFSLTPDEDTDEMPTTAMMPVATKKKKKKKKKSDMMGLGMADLIGLHTKASTVEQLTKTNEKLEKEAEKYKEKYEDLKEQMLQKKYTVEKSDSRDNLISTIISQAPSIVPHLAGMFSKMPVAGLAGTPVIENNYTEVQQQLIDVITVEDDSFNELCLNIHHKIANQLPGFAKDLMELIYDYENPSEETEEEESQS